MGGFFFTQYDIMEMIEMTFEEVVNYSESLPQEEKNRLIQLVVGEQSVIMNVSLQLSEPIKITAPFLIKNSNLLTNP